MATVVYRGVPYDTEHRRQQKQQIQQEPQQYNDESCICSIFKKENTKK
jgi:hypothetical protein